jgi:predicted kinase
MEAVIFIGIQASGKSTFYKERFFNSHVRINLDMLRTRNREKMLFNACLAARQSFVVDNTNCTKADRRRYIAPAREAGFKVLGYYFNSGIEECRRRNAQRPESQAVPDLGLLGTRNRLELPTVDERFDRLYYVKIGSDNVFIVEDWRNEV